MWCFPSDHRRAGGLAAGLLAGLTPLLLLAPPAQARTIRCSVSQARQILYAGRCDFQPSDPDGSFSLVPLDRPSISGANPISVTLMAPGLADVRGLSADGINSRWGTARRSRQEPACWQGTDFRICAY